MNDIQKTIEQMEQTRKRQKFIIRWVVIPFVVIYLMNSAFIICCK